MNINKSIFKACIVLMGILFFPSFGYVYDLNKDGYDDIVVSNLHNGIWQSLSYSINSYIYWGNSSGTYDTKTELPTNGGHDNSIADLNGDGYLDIVFSNYYNGSSYNLNAYIYWGNSSASYSTKTELPTNGGVSSSVADLNKDGYMDIIFSNNYSNGSNNVNSYIYWGNSSASYTTKTELGTVGAMSSSIADLNKDGYMDLVFSNKTNGSTWNINSYIYWGDASNSYNTKTELATKGANDNTVIDINGDGYLDIVFSNYYNGSTYEINSYIYWGDASNSYNTKTELATSGAYANSAADVNGDGYIDIVFSSFYNGSSYNLNSYIYWGDLSFSYTTKTMLATQGAVGNSISDLNNDGYADIIFANFHNGTSWNINSYVYWGNASASFNTRTELTTHAATDITAGNISGLGQTYFPEAQTIPEPATFILLAIAVLSKALVGKYRKH